MDLTRFFEKIKFIKCEANNDLPIPFFPENKILFGKFFYYILRLIN